MVNRKNNRTLYHQNWDLIEKPVITFKIQMHIRSTLKFFEKYKCSSIAFFSKAPDVSNEQSCLKTIGLHDLLLLPSLFHFFYFIISTPISFRLCSPISPTLFFSFDVLFQVFIKCSGKAFVYMYKNMYIYILENL